MTIRRCALYDVSFYLFRAGCVGLLLSALICAFIVVVFCRVSSQELLSCRAYFRFEFASYTTVREGP